MHPRPILRLSLMGTALAITIPLAACTTTRPAGPPSTPAVSTPHPVTVTTSTSWDAPTDASAAAAQAGLPMLGQEMLAVHYHAHLDVRIAGTPVLVPAGLVIEWGQPLAAGQVGPHRLGQGEVLRVFRNGQPVSGDPAALRFTGHDQDVVWVGPATAYPSVPATYRFPQGL